MKNMRLVILSTLTTWERRQADEVHALVLVTAYSCSDGEWDLNSGCCDFTLRCRILGNRFSYDASLCLFFKMAP
jgi:hypothetical protein